MAKVKLYLLCLILAPLLISCQKEELLEFEVYDVRVNRFTVDVNVAPDGETPKNEADWCVLIHPTTTDNRLHRLVIYCHSGGGRTTNHGSEAEGTDVARYLVSKGYAVLEVNGMPGNYAQQLDVDLGRTVGSYVSFRSAIAGYNYVTKNFNIADDGCFVFSSSNGGLLAGNIVNLSGFPILAQSGLAPLLSIERNGWFVPSAAMFIKGFGMYQNRANIIRLFGMKNITTQEELNAAKYEKERVGKYDPFDYAVNQTTKAYPVPYLIFTLKDDAAVFYGVAKDFGETLKARGSNIELGDMTEYGGHNIKPTPIIVGHFTYMGQRYDLRQTVKLIGDYFDKYNPNLM